MDRAKNNSKHIVDLFLRDAARRNWSWCVFFRRRSWFQNGRCGIRRWTFWHTSTGQSYQRKWKGIRSARSRRKLHLRESKIRWRFRRRRLRNKERARRCGWILRRRRWQHGRTFWWRRFFYTKTRRSQSKRSSGQLGERARNLWIFGTSPGPNVLILTEALYAWAKELLSL